MKGIKKFFKKEWKNISPEFTEGFKEEWEDLGFDYEQTQEWINVGLKVGDADYAYWLKITKNKDAEWLLNHGNDTELRTEYYEHLIAVANGSQFSMKIIRQIKDFKFIYQDRINELTLDQKSLLDELVTNETLKERYKKYGLCKECKQPNNHRNNMWPFFNVFTLWCQPCNSKHFRAEFKNWTSGNSVIDQFIQKFQLEAVNEYQVIEWIPYERLTNIEYLTEGGFSTVYKAIWVDGLIREWDVVKNRWKRKNVFYNLNGKVILKKLHSSQDITTNFLQEIAKHKIIWRDSTPVSSPIVYCYGISQDPETKNYIMVMEYISGGNLRNYLKNSQSGYFFNFRLIIHHLSDIVNHLNYIHQCGFVHRDFHSGNILRSKFFGWISITDLGLSRPADEEDHGKVYGVLPYVAPEVLRGQPYTQAADIYSFGMIAYEMLTRFPPYHNVPHDQYLTLNICKGLRPNLNNVSIPQLLKDLISSCWDAEPTKRPTASELCDTIDTWYSEIRGKIGDKNTDFCRQYKEIKKKFNKSLSQKISEYKIHPSATYTSRSLSDFANNLPEPQNSKEINDQFYSSQQPTLQLDEFVLDELNLEDDQAEQQAQIELPPK